ncbi:MAG: hypothetical protein JNG84_01485 [Archangium sp.]|nr:hypothetical protein [Archangium sp.]
MSLVPLSLVAAALLSAGPTEVETEDGDILYEETASAEDRIRALEEKLAALEAGGVTGGPPPVQGAAKASSVALFGYADFGFFAPLGNNGVGYVQDFGNAVFPQYAGRFGWVFLGDILATAVNSRGEVADLGDAPGVRRYDGIRSRGAAGFVLNEATFGVKAAFTEDLLFNAAVNFTPRTGSDFSFGDTFDVDLVQLEWTPTESKRTSFFVGKMESVIGVEYRERRAMNRFGITPSLIARYTVGTPLGVKVRSKFFDDDLLTVAVAFTNGSSTQERFHFFDETDSNSGKTLSGRVSLKPPFWGELELGFSAMWGPQDRVRNSAEPMWFIGADLLWNKGPVVVKGQFLRGFSKGDDLDAAYALALRVGGYVEVNWLITSVFGIIARAELRDADVWLGTERLYITRSWRAVGGVRFAFNENVVLKAEYLKNGEYGGVPEIPNDIFTSSLVLSY